MDNFREQVLELLKEAIVLVEFEKADGSIRLMKCTLKDDKILKWSYSPKREPDLEKQTVWDVEKEDWRCFKWSKVRSVQVA